MDHAIGIGLLRALFPMALLGLAACSPGEEQISKVKQLIVDSPGFISNPTLIVNTGDQGWMYLANARQRGGFVDTGHFCSVGDILSARIAPAIKNYSGSLRDSGNAALSSEKVGLEILHDAKLLKYRTARIDIGNPDVPEPYIYYCQAFSDTSADWAAKHAKIVTKFNGLPGIEFAHRSDLQTQFQNRYEMDIPAKGKVPIVALEFTYKLTPTMTGLTSLVDGQGTGKAKAYLDSDSGKWIFIELTFQDPDLAYASGPSSPLNVEPASIGASIPDNRWRKAGF